MLNAVFLGAAGEPGPDKISGIFKHVESNYAGLEGMSEGLARGRLKLDVESKTQSGDVTIAGRVGTSKLGEAGVHLAYVLCGILSYSYKFKNK